MTWQCKIGLHDYEWTYDYPYSSCDQTGRCKRTDCDHIATRVRHRFGDWEYESYYSCKLVKRCVCSDVIEGSIKHTWGSWDYKSSTECEKRRYCEHNSDHFEERAASHTWGSWDYKSSTECERRRYCERNSDHFEDGSASHIWAEPTYIKADNCERVAVCKRNSDHTMTSIDHMWGPPVVSDNCMMVSRCTRCPDGIDYIGTRHDFLPPERITIETEGVTKLILIRLCRNCTHSERDEIS